MAAKWEVLSEFLLHPNHPRSVLLVGKARTYPALHDILLEPRREFSPWGFGS